MNALNNDVVKTMKDFLYPKICSFLEITEKKWKKSMLNGKGKQKVVASKCKQN